jgi:hypothetical protein
VFTVLGHSLESLGVALVVGAIFGFGTFIAQFWAVATQREGSVYDEVYGNLEYLKDLNRKRQALIERIEVLEEQQETGGEASPDTPAVGS